MYLTQIVTICTVILKLTRYSTAQKEKEDKKKKIKFQAILWAHLKIFSLRGVIYCWVVDLQPLDSPFEAQNKFHGKYACQLLELTTSRREMQPANLAWSGLLRIPWKLLFLLLIFLLLLLPQNQLSTKKGMSQNHCFSFFFPCSVWLPRKKEEEVEENKRNKKEKLFRKWVTACLSVLFIQCV